METGESTTRLPDGKYPLRLTAEVAQPHPRAGGKEIANVVKPVMQGYKFQSVKEFKALLGLFHVTVEEAHKTIKGKTYHGLVYAATDEKGERTGVAIKSSKIGKSVGYEALQKKFVKSKQ
ncbi:hypothetical protein [Parabacteroides goldsteinii]|uniref:hypothetical protein n=1 Tax=Parabacteroides goldsteinii TaxID=328812 RepID=UPI002672DD6B|nr:hypothetical protein [Parabacteroides goldsteinii]